MSDWVSVKDKLPSKSGLYLDLVCHILNIDEENIVRLWIFKKCKDIPTIVI